MRQLPMSACVLAAASFVTATPAAAIEPQTVAKRLEASVVRVLTVGEGGQVSGSGMVVSRKGHVATAYHVIRPHIKNQWKIFVVVRGNAAENRRPAKLVKAYPGEDLAVLKVEGLARRPVRLNDRDSGRPFKGTTIFAIGILDAGSRLGAGIDTSFTTGTVSRVFTGSWEEKGPRIRIIQHTAPTNRGNSGGPVVNACGQVVGVNTQREIAVILLPGGIPIVTDFIQGVYFASHSSVLVAKLKELNIGYSGIRATCRHFLGVASTNFRLYGVIAVLITILLLAFAITLLFRGPRQPVIRIFVGFGYAMKNGAKAVGRLVRKPR